MARYSEYSLLANHQLEEHDVTETLNCTGWLTGNAVVHIILEKGNLNSDRNLVDPAWLAAWVLSKCEAPPTTPEFFLPKDTTLGGVTTVRGLVIPYCISNQHWVVILVDLENDTATLYDSSPFLSTADNVRDLMQRFYNVFQDQFRGTGPFIFNGGDNNHENNCACQVDGFSCGIYASGNSIMLLNWKTPRKYTYGGDVGAFIQRCRVELATLLRERMRASDDRFYMPLSILGGETLLAGEVPHSCNFDCSTPWAQCPLIED